MQLFQKPLGMNNNRNKVFLFVCEKIIFALFLPLPLCAATQTIALAPAGHAAQTGRTLAYSYERTQAYALSHALQETLSKEYGVTCLITRQPGQELSLFHHASLANQANVAAAVSLHLFAQQNPQPSINLYHLVLNPLQESLAGRPMPENTLLPVSVGHIPAANTSQRLANTLYQHLAVHRATVLCRQPAGIPCLPLLGYSCPAIAVEIGIKEDTDWQPLVPLIAKALAAVLPSL